MVSLETTVLDEIVDLIATLPGVQVTQTELESSTEAGIRIDAVVTLETLSGTFAYAVETKRGVTRSTLDAVIAQLQRIESQSGHKPLLATNFVSEALVDSLLDAGINFVDTAGNMFLQAPGFYALVRGKKQSETRTYEAFSATGLKIIYALLTYPQLRKSTYRDIKEATGVGLGSVSRTVTSLLEQNYLIKGKDGTLHLAKFRDLQARWELGYLETLRPKLGPSAWRYSGLNRHEALEILRPYSHILIGGEEAAARLTRYLKPQTLTLHADREAQKRIRVALKLLPAKEAPDVYLLDVPVPRDLTQADGERLASRLLVRAELLAHGGDRLREVANKLLEDDAQQ